MRRNIGSHKHLWEDRGTRDWRYQCNVCGKKSRNPLAQPPGFREPLRMTSVVFIGPDAGRVIHSIINEVEVGDGSCLYCGSVVRGWGGAPGCVCESCAARE